MASTREPAQATPKAALSAAIKTARDIMQQPVSVRVDETVEKALEVAVKSWLEDLPVTDAEGRVVGYLDCFEIMKNLSK